ncbi:hypothetical protein KH5_03360 [Urechidicola sp. KH5]
MVELNNLTNSLWEIYLEEDYDTVFKKIKSWFSKKTRVKNEELLFLIAISSVSNQKINSRLFWKHFIYGHRYDIFGNRIYKDLRKKFSDRWEELIYQDFIDARDFWSFYFQDIRWKKTFPKQNFVSVYVESHEWSYYIEKISESEGVKYNKYYNEVQYYLEDFENDERFVEGEFTYKNSAKYFAKSCLIYHLRNTFEKVVDQFILEGFIEEIKGKWVSEHNLYLKIKNHLTSFNVIPQGSPKFLNGQRFDIWIPELSLAIEYNGLQHYKPVDIFGGIEGFNATKERDKMKREKCRMNNVELIEVRENYDFKELISKIEKLI